MFGNAPARKGFVDALTGVLMSSFAFVSVGCSENIPCRDENGTVVACPGTPADGSILADGSVVNCFDPYTGAPTGRCDAGVDAGTDSGVDAGRVQCFNPVTGVPTGLCDAGVDSGTGGTDSGVDSGTGGGNLTMTATLYPGRSLVTTGTAVGGIPCGQPIVVGLNSLSALPGTSVTSSTNANGETVLTAHGLTKDVAASFRFCALNPQGQVVVDMSATVGYSGNCVLSSTADGYNLLSSLTASSGTVQVTTTDGSNPPLCRTVIR